MTANIGFGSCVAPVDVPYSQRVAIPKNNALRKNGSLLTLNLKKDETSCYFPLLG